MLEATVHRAQQTYSQLTTLTSICHQQHDNIQQLSRQLKAVTAALHVATQPRRCNNCDDPLASLPSSASSLLQSCIVSSALASSLLLSSQVGICVTDGWSGAVLDVNDELLSLCGWPRSQMLDSGMPVIAWSNVRSQVQLRRAGDDKLAVNRDRLGLQADQYGRSWRQLWQLYSGEVDKADAVWRCRHAPGDSLFDMSCSTHVASWADEAEEGNGCGEKRRVPGRVVWIISVTDAMRMD